MYDEEDVGYEKEEGTAYTFDIPHCLLLVLSAIKRTQSKATIVIAIAFVICTVRLLFFSLTGCILYINIPLLLHTAASMGIKKGRGMKKKEELYIILIVCCVLL